MHAASSAIVLDPALDNECINTLRFLSVDAVQKADSGHPGLPMGAAAMAYVLWTRFLNIIRPILDGLTATVSCCHPGMVRCCCTACFTSPATRFRDGSTAPGHPERGVTPGVETTTGPLGQGFGNGVGLAMAEAHLAACYNRPGAEIVNHFTYGIVSDGDLMEGVSSEAASLAGHLKLGKLIYLYDDNRVTLSAGTDITFTEDRARRFEAYGWHVQSVAGRQRSRGDRRGAAHGSLGDAASIPHSGADPYRLWRARQAGQF